MCKRLEDYAYLSTAPPTFDDNLCKPLLVFFASSTKSSNEVTKVFFALRSLMRTRVTKSVVAISACLTCKGQRRTSDEIVHQLLESPTLCFHQTWVIGLRICRFWVTRPFLDIPGMTQKGENADRNVGCILPIIYTSNHRARKMDSGNLR